jgi:hypothetical protein
MSEEKKSCDKQTAFGKQIDEMFDSIPFYKWWRNDRKIQRFDPLSIAEEAWNVSEKQARLAILTELEREIEELQAAAKKHFVAIDDKEDQEYFDGRWRMAREILALIRSKKGGA